MPRHPRPSSPESISLFDEDPDSPTDGYFVNRHHPQDIFLQNPTAASDVKPQAVSDGGLPSSPKSSHVYYSGLHAQSAHSPPFFHQVNETSPLLSSFQDTPPSYSDAMGRSFEYSAVRQDDDPERRESRVGLLSLEERRDPESIGAPRDLEEEILNALPRFGRRRTGWFHSWTKRRCTLLGLVAFGAIALTIAIVVAISRRGSPTVVPPPSFQPSLPDQEAKDPFRNGLAVWPTHCGNKSTTKFQEWNFDAPSEFHFIESMQSDSQVVYGVTGESHLAPAPADQASDIRIEYYVASSQPMTVQNIQFSQSASGVEITGASFEESLAGSTACMVVTAIIYAKPGMDLKKLQIESQNTKVTLHSDLNLKVQDSTTISLTKGGLKASANSLNSRETIIDIISGGVTGTYALYDLLSVKTQSGAIGITVEPKEVNKDAPRPADFQVRSRSGSVNVKYSSLSPPDRDYKVSIEANMGSVTGTLIHGSETTINAYSGSITGTIIPYRASNSSSTFTTNTISGSTKITLTSPFANPGSDISALKSEHHGKSGSIKLNYPQEWMGQLQGGTQSGRLNLRGKDVRVIREGGGAAGKRVVAEKGKGNSSLTFDTMSGSCTIQIGRG